MLTPDQLTFRGPLRLLDCRQPLPQARRPGLRPRASIQAIARLLTASIRQAGVAEQEAQHPAQAEMMAMAHGHAHRVEYPAEEPSPCVVTFETADGYVHTLVAGDSAQRN